MQPDEDIGDVLAVAEEDQQDIDPDPETPGHASLDGGPDPVGDVEEGDVVDDEMDDADLVADDENRDGEDF
jgi:hypothetical protein